MFWADSQRPLSLGCVFTPTALCVPAAALWIMPPLAVRFGLAPSFLFATGVCAAAWLCNLGGAAMGRSVRFNPILIRFNSTLIRH